MYIPIDNLYDWIGGISRDTLIYRFSPHGSKNLADLTVINAQCATKKWDKFMDLVPVVCYDQEPLDYDAYNNLDWKTLRDLVVSHRPDVVTFQPQYATQKFWEHLAQQNLAATIARTLSDKQILLHTEQRSQNLEKYKNSNFVPAYWWSHAMIARDWYRFAEHDPDLVQDTTGDFKFDFNIYCRAWTGTREYRLKFLEQIIDQQLVDKCRISFCAVDDSKHYTQHTFANAVFQPRQDLGQIPSQPIPSWRSAEYDVDHYQTCALDVVLETLFDDDRLYLTEKILRPIACNKPFVLVATHGSLAYLRSYGFQTFNGIIDESYDIIKDPVKRLQAVLRVMKDISLLPELQKQRLWNATKSICEHNQRWFFSNVFAQQIQHELRRNILAAEQEIRAKYHHGKTWIRERATRSSAINNELINQHLVGEPWSRTQTAQMLLQCRQNQRRSTIPSQSDSTP